MKDGKKKEDKKPKAEAGEAKPVAPKDADKSAAKEKIKNKKRSRSKAPVDESTLPAEERLRRQQQREHQKKAKIAREQGQKYVPLKKQKRKRERRESKGEVRLPRRAPQLVVLPIFWKDRHDEMAQIMEAAKAIEQWLRVAGYTVFTDASNKLNPGEKMKRWEVKGLKARIEIGPKDAQAGNVTLAITTTPGVVANKLTFKATSEALLTKIQAVVGAPKGRQEAEAYQTEAKKDVQEAIAAAIARGEADDEDRAMFEGAAPASKVKKFESESESDSESSESEEDEAEKEEEEEHEEEEEEEEEPVPKKKAKVEERAASGATAGPSAASKGKAAAAAAAAAPPKPVLVKKAGPSGDAVDEFVIEVEAEEDAGKKFPKGKKGRGSKKGPGGDLEEEPAWGEDGEKKKKAKVVVFKG